MTNFITLFSILCMFCAFSGCVNQEQKRDYQNVEKMELARWVPDTTKRIEIKFEGYSLFLYNQDPENHSDFQFYVKERNSEIKGPDSCKIADYMGYLYTPVDSSSNIERYHGFYADGYLAKLIVLSKDTSRKFVEVLIADSIYEISLSTPRLMLEKENILITCSVPWGFQKFTIENLTISDKLPQCDFYPDGFPWGH